ncbi:MAG: TonB-dependent receptor [Candidatus Acidiferrales bacterium]
MVLRANCRPNYAALLLVHLFLLCTALSIEAQVPTGTILGTVKDPSGGAIAGASIKVTNSATDLLRSFTTETDGSYRFPGLPAGTYDLEVVRSGFKNAVQKGLVLTVGQEAVLDITLQVGSNEQTVTVTAEAPLIDTTTSSLGGLVTQQKIEDLPLNGRNYTDLILLQPGVTQQTDEQAGTPGSVFSSNGESTRSNNYLLDGTITQNAFGFSPTSVSGSSLGLDGIQEYRVVTNMFSAEYGLVMGSQTNIVSKGGTNQFHGDIFEYLRNSALDSRNYFDLLSELPASVPGGGKRIPPFRRNQFGGAFGGPVQRDKTFFYAVYESLREDLGNPLYTGIDTVPAAGCHGSAGTVITSNAFGPCPQIANPANPAQNASVTISPAASGLLALLPVPDVPGTNEYTALSNQHTVENYGQIRVDHSFSGSDTFFARHTIDDTDQLRPHSVTEFHDLWTSRSQYLTLSENHIFSPALLNTVRGSFSRTSIDTVAESSIPSSSSIDYIPGTTVGIIIIGGLNFNPWFGPAINPGTFVQNIFSGSDDLVWTKGKHALKFGTLINHFQFGNTSGLIFSGFSVYPSTAAFLQGQPIFVQAEQQANSATGVTPANLNRYWSFNTFGFYAQDDYRLLPHLTLNLGLRYEFDTVPHDRNGGNFAIRDIQTVQGGLPGVPFSGVTPGPIMQNDSLKNFSPRVGFAWDVMGNGKTSVRGGFGLYYDVANIDSVLYEHQIGTPPSASIQSVLYAPFGATPTLTLPVDFAGASSAIVTSDYHAKQPYSMQYNLSVERQLPGGLALTLAYVGSRGVHLWALHDANPVVPSAFVGGIPQWVPPPGPFPGFFCPDGAVSFINSCRENPNLSTVGAFSTVGDSWYNGLQVGLVKQISKGLEFQSSYTYSKLLDTTQGQIADAADASDAPSNPFNTRLDKGPTAFDAKHNWRFNLLYHFPNIQSDRFAAKLLHGWWMGNIVALQTGFPFSPLVGFNQSNSELGLGDLGIALANDRPSFVTASNLAAALVIDPPIPGVSPGAQIYNPKTVIVGRPDEWYNPHMFTLPAFGTLGDVPRGVLVGPGLADWDFSLNKDTALPFLGEKGRAEFRAEFFNIINQTNFNFPGISQNNQNFIQTGIGTGIVNPAAGVVSTTATNARQIQFGLRLEF